MTTPAALESHGRMLESEWSTFVAVTLEAAGLIPGEGLQHAGPETSMRVVAIRALHEALVHAMLERQGELRTHIQMAAFAQVGLRLGEPPLGRAGAGAGVAIGSHDTSLRVR